MRSAESVFRELNARLDLPARRRALLLREIRADFEDLVATLVAEGLTPETAQARALEMLAPNADDAGALTGLHRSSYARLVEHLRPGRVQVVERVGIGAMAALAVLAPMLAMGRGSLLPPPVLAALGLVALLTVVNLAWQAFHIVVRGDADAVSLARAGAVQAGLVALTVSVGGLAVTGQAYAVTASWEAAGDVATSSVFGAAAACAAAAALTVGLTILGVFGALALFQWYVAARAVEVELNALLEPVSVSKQE